MNVKVRSNVKHFDETINRNKEQKNYNREAGGFIRQLRNLHLVQIDNFILPFLLLITIVTIA